MQPLAIRVRSRKRIVAESESELHAALTVAEEEADRAGTMGLVDFEAANGNRLSMLVGGADTALSWRYPGDTDPRFLSEGDPSAAGSVPCSRDFNNRIECPRWALIPRADGLAALDEFAASNEIPEAVQWADYAAPRSR
jgi:hypothetical protein